MQILEKKTKRKSLISSDGYLMKSRRERFWSIIDFSLYCPKQTDEKMRFLFLSKHWVRYTHRGVYLYPLVSHYVGASPLIPPCDKREIGWSSIKANKKISHGEKNRKTVYQN